jgi:ABC-type sulfate transport system substrate-binding protein
MACDISKGRLEACKESVGGIKNLYIANYSSAMYAGMDDSATKPPTDAAFNGQVNVYQFEVRGDNNTFEETNENSRDNGTSFWTQSGSFVIKAQNAETMMQLKLLSYGRPHIIIEDYNGKFRMAGAQNGVEVSVNTSTGGAMGDLYGYTISFEGREVLPSLFILSTLVAAGSSSGFDVQTSNMSNE